MCNLIIDPENQINLRRRDIAIEMCKCCAMFVCFVFIIMIVGLILNSMYSEGVKNQRPPPRFNFSKNENDTFILFRRFKF